MGAEDRRGASLLAPEFLERLERLELNARKILRGERRGDAASARRGPGTLFREHRSYVPGDDVRHLDWNAFLRLGDLVIKEFEAEEAPRLVLFLDRSASMRLPEKKFEMARRLCAALAYIGLCRNAAVVCAPVPHSGARPAFRGRAAVARVLEHLSGLECTGQAGFLREFQATCPPGRPTGLAVVFSDFYETGELRTALRFLKRRGFAVHALHLVAPEDLEPAAQGLLLLADVETGRTVRERITPGMARAYRDAVHQHRKAVESSCHEMEVGYHRVSTSDPVESIVLTLLRRGTLVK